jgi:hypothetical protein
VEFDLIDKPIVLDAAQEAVRRHAPPLVIIGPAGSGKTAVTLAKMREATGNVLYVTLSAYLAQTARRLYGAHGYENPRQDAEFMSFREFVDSFAVPEGEEVRFAAFRASQRRRAVAVAQATRLSRLPSGCRRVGGAATEGRQSRGGRP